MVIYQSSLNPVRCILLDRKKGSIRSVYGPAISAARATNMSELTKGWMFSLRFATSFV